MGADEYEWKHKTGWVKCEPQLTPGDQKDIDKVIEGRLGIYIGDIAEALMFSFDRYPPFGHIIMQHSQFPEAALIMHRNHPEYRIRKMCELVLKKRGIELE
jgi:hypothetical protein